MTDEKLPDELEETFFELTNRENLPADGDEVDTDEFSIEQLGAAYARVMRGDDDSASEYDDDQDGNREAVTTDTRSEQEQASCDDRSEALNDSADDACCPVSELSVLEAALFVGAPEGTKLTSRKLASIMREVSPKEIKGLVAQLNAQYAEQNSAFRIVTRDGGYSMELIPELEGLREGFLGEIREAKLAQSAVDVLAVVAYHQPVTRQEIDRIWQRPSGSLLNQLVQRNLLAIDTTEVASRDRTYVTTGRFLETLGLENLEDLPKTADASEVDDY